MSGIFYAQPDNSVAIRRYAPETGYEAPTPAELRALAKIVGAAHPELGVEKIPEDELARAMLATGHMFRLAEPDTCKYADAHFSDANGYLKFVGLASVGGEAFTASIFIHNDIFYRAANAAVGQVFELGLNPTYGRKCSNAWRGLLEGRPLLAPTPSRFQPKTERGAPPVRIFAAGRELPPDR